MNLELTSNKTVKLERLEMYLMAIKLEVDAIDKDNIGLANYSKIHDINRYVMPMVTEYADNLKDQLSNDEILGIKDMQVKILEIIRSKQ